MDPLVVSDATPYRVEVTLPGGDWYTLAEPKGLDAVLALLSVLLDADTDATPTLKVTRLPK